jgi:CspA family cold shock protein
MVEGHGHDGSDCTQGQHSKGGCKDQEGPPVAHQCHGGNANSPGSPAPQARESEPGRITLKDTDQHGPGSHTLNPRIHADAVTAGRVPRRTKKVDYVPTGKVKWYDKEKGFGFLAGEDGQEVFLPKSALPEGVLELKAGTRVEFGVADGRKGAQALGLRVLDKTPSIAKAKRPSARDLAPLVQDLVTVLDNLSGTLSAGKYPEGNKGKAIAAALRKVADELDV